MSIELQFACRPKPPLHGLRLNKSPIKNHAILFGSGRVVEPDQTKLGFTKPNRKRIIPYPTFYIYIYTHTKTIHVFILEWKNMDKVLSQIMLQELRAIRQGLLIDWELGYKFIDL